MEKLQACRFCGEIKEIKVMSAGVAWAECTVCRARGPIELFEKDAVESWNNGVDPKLKERRK